MVMIQMWWYRRWDIGMNMIEDGIYLVCWPTDLLSDLQASMLSWFRFQSRVNSSLTKHTKSLITDLHSLKLISKDSPLFILITNVWSAQSKTHRYSYSHTWFKDILEQWLFLLQGLNLTINKKKKKTTFSHLISSSMRCFVRPPLY